MPDSSAVRDDFAPFPFCVKALSGERAATRYLVYRTAQESVAVMAASADEAVKLSAVEKPYRICREEALQRLLLDSTMFE